MNAINENLYENECNCDEFCSQKLEESYNQLNEKCLQMETKINEFMASIYYRIVVCLGVVVVSGLTMGLWALLNSFTTVVSQMLWFAGLVVANVGLIFIAGYHVVIALKSMQFIKEVEPLRKSVEELGLIADRLDQMFEECLQLVARVERLDLSVGFAAIAEKAVLSDVVVVFVLVVFLRHFDESMSKAVARAGSFISLYGQHLSIGLIVKSLMSRKLSVVKMAFIDLFRKLRAGVTRFGNYLSAFTFYFL